MSPLLTELVKLGKKISPSHKFTWGVGSGEDAWFYFSKKQFEIIFYFHLSGKIKSICFWNGSSFPAKYIEKNNIENLFSLLEEDILHPTIKEWILFNLNSFSTFEDEKHDF